MRFDGTITGSSLSGSMTSSRTVTSDRTEDLNDATRASIIQVCVDAHQEEDFRNLFSYIPSGGWHFLAYDGDQLVSHAVVTTRWLQPEDRPLLRTAYVDAVATLPSHQGRGFGSEVMRHLEREVDREYEIACLETERESFYKRLSWRVWRGPLAGRSENGLMPTPHQTGIMILRLSRTPALDLDKALSIECQPDRIW